MHKQWAAGMMHKRYVTDSQIDSWISGSGPFPYYYQPSYSTSSVASCNSNENQFPGTTSPSSEDLRKRDDWVTRSGSKLYLDGYEFRPVGPNIYWLGLDENVNPSPSYPSQTRVWEMMGIASAMGANAIRAHTLGISFGNSLSVVTGPNTYNDGAYQAIDFAIMAARVYGLKLIIPLVDNYNWYHGGKYNFVGWGGHSWSGTGAAITPPDVGGFFYNDTNVVQLFTNYITHHLTHVNQYTGVALKDDPTIMMWETGNELSVYQQADGPPPNAWTQQICGLIKSLAPNQLCMDGTYGIYPNSGQLSNGNVDALTDHFYPSDNNRLTTGAHYTQNTAGKVYIAGEWDWTNQYGGDGIQSFMSQIEGLDGAGDFFWSLFGHDSDCCTLVTHNDGYTMYYPGTTSGESAE
ncbi:glycoside hydrolase family 5 protein [Calocera cornea HHB12733]|uniref:mannan endo-1,4-beta-mannosidase n=1 Tax=Calocera cornea HHB12733 TaxID=1353952 RepID=A0A165JGC1_9BASI|nr:glycoside hydrolase family 5 protein [Calocera cornea HHB12733]